MAAGCHQRLSSSGMAALCKLHSASEVKYIVPAFQCSQLRHLLWQSSSPGRCGVTLADCCCGSRDVAGVRTRRLLLRQQRRCGVTLSHCCCGSRDVAAIALADCCCGSRDVAASHSVTTVLATQLPAVAVDMSHQLLRRSQHRACVGAHWAHAGQTSLAAAASSNCLR